MKTAKRLIATALSAVLAMSAIPALACSAEGYNSYYPYANVTQTTAVKEVTVEFAVLIWSEDRNDELAIIGCYPMTTTEVAAYGTMNVIGVCIFNGELQIPSEINGKTVKSIDSLSGLNGLNVKTVRVNEYVAVSEKVVNTRKALVYWTEDELRLQQILV